MWEVESILNSRLNTVVSDDSRVLQPLTPNYLLSLKPDSPMPPSVFRKENLFSWHRSRQIQYLSDIFWKRWSNEYLLLLQSCQKWLYQRSCFGCCLEHQQEFPATLKSSLSLSGREGLCSQSLSQHQVFNSQASCGQATLTGQGRGMKIHSPLNDLFSVFSCC